MNVNRRCKSEGSLLEIESDEELTDAQTVKQRIFDELKRIIAPQFNLIQNNSPRCPFCCPQPHKNDSNSYRCPICFQKTSKVTKQSDIVPYVAKSQPSFSLRDFKSEELVNQALAIEDVKKSTHNLQEISNTLNQLYKARDLLDPVINEIILSASQLTVREIHEFRKDNHPICYITAKQFKDTSDVINMFLKVVERLSDKRSPLPTNTTSNSLSYFNEVIVNTLYLVNKDDPYGSPDEQKVYVDKFVLKELIQLHEVLGCTIAVIKDAEKKERHKSKGPCPSPIESDSIELTRKLSAASKASLSHKQRVHKESKSKKHRSPKSCTAYGKDRECRGIKPAKKPSRITPEVTKYKECSRGDRKCKPPEPDKECQKKGGLFACCNRKKCKKKQDKGTQEDNKKKSISFAESKNNVLLDFKVDGRPIQIKMDKNTKDYLVKSLQKSKALNITASDEISANAQESSNFINSVMLDRQKYCKTGSSYTVECSCDSDDSNRLSSVGKSQTIKNDSCKNFDTGSSRKPENSCTQTKNSKTSSCLPRSRNAFCNQCETSPFVCLNFARDTQKLNFIKENGSQSFDSDSDSLSSKCTSAVTKLYPKSDEESTGIQTFLPNGTNNYFWDPHPDTNLFDQTVSLFPLPKYNYQPRNPPDITNIKDECRQKKETQLKYNFDNDGYRKSHKTSQSTETHRVEYTALRCIAEKDIELNTSVESCNYTPSKDCSNGSFTKKSTAIQNQSNLRNRPSKRTSETSFKIYTAFNTQQAPINQCDLFTVCYKCKRTLQNEEAKGQSTKNCEEGNDSVAIQTSCHSLKNSAMRSSQTEDMENLRTIQKDVSLQRLSERSLSFQKSNSAQTSSDLNKTSYRFPRMCKEATQETSNGSCRGCLKRQSRSLASSNTPPKDYRTDRCSISTQEPTLKESGTDFENLQSGLQTGRRRIVCKGNKRCGCSAAQGSYINTSSFPGSSEDFRNSQNNLQDGRIIIKCTETNHCSDRPAKKSYLSTSSLPEQSSEDVKNLQNDLEGKKKYITCAENEAQTDCRVRCQEEAKETQTLTDQCNCEIEKKSSVTCSAVQTNDVEESSLSRKRTGSYQGSDNRSKNTVANEDGLCCKVLNLCRSTSTESKCKSDNAGIQTDQCINQNSDNEQSETQKDSQSNRCANVSSLQTQTGSCTGKKDLMVIKIVVPEAAAAAIEQSLRDEATATSESNNNLPVAVEIVSSFSTNVKVLKSDADIRSDSKQLIKKCDRRVDKASFSRHIEPVKNFIPPRHMSANRIKVSKATVSRRGVRVNSDSICRCNQLPQNRRYDRLSDSNKNKSNNQGDLNVCECKSCSCPSLMKFDDENENSLPPSSDITNDQRGSSSKNVGTWRQTVLEAIYRLLFGENCENFKKGQECEIDVQDTATTVKYSQECQYPSTHTFKNHNKNESVTYRCNLVSPNFGDLSVMRKAIDRDLINQLGDILKVKSSKLSRKGNKLDLSLVLSFQTQKTNRFKTKENISCITESENGLKGMNSTWGFMANFKSGNSSFRNDKYSRQITSSSFLKNILRKHSCHSILINPLVENSLQNGQNVVNFHKRIEPGDIF